MTDFASQQLVQWQEREALAEALVPIVGSLYRRQAVVTEVFGVSLVGKAPVTALQIHDQASAKAGQPIRLVESLELARVMERMELGRVRVDLGKLALRFRASGSTDLSAWAREQLAAVSRDKVPMPSAPQDVVLYGFGRIGRLVARLLISKTGGGDKYRLRAIVLRPGKAELLERRASLFERDSVHGPFEGTVRVDAEREALILNGNYVQILYANEPNELDYTAHGIQNAVIIDNTGKWRDAAGMGKHLECPGAGRVILTAPGKGVPNIVFGVNHHTLGPDDKLVSAASCTTNAIVPALATLDEAFGIEHGHLETVHAYTNDQNLIDNFHKKDRRGRGAPLNMVITSTGAATAAALALPQLAGKLTGNAIRVPTPNVSLAIMNLTLGRETSVEEVNEHFRKVSLDSPLHTQIDITTSPEIVSSDLVGNAHAGIVDSFATLVNGRNAVVYVWYDNEFGYSCQVVRLMQHLAGVSPVRFPAPGT
ncbi:MAG: glyceraldehyde-3-phosphate dehydrogenase [Alphaproteobacteria bacterium]|nr:glyceraldehyde-3-phosphate dehydrogenase [Alphaproteobacteria bacterium]MCB9693999.1 glyceraldehyde-3-phosphate dehydrogenase [Alphaproteobacteria bacterium]